MHSFEEFRPAWWLRHRHAQTIWPSVVRRCRQYPGPGLRPPLPGAYSKEPDIRDAEKIPGLTRPNRRKAFVQLEEFLGI